MSLLKFKVTPKSELKYNKILKWTNINSKLLFVSLLIYYLCYYLYKILSVICVAIYSHMMEEIKIPIYKLIDQLNYISNKHGGVMQNKIYCN